MDSAGVVVSGSEHARPALDDERFRPVWLRELVANAIYNQLVCDGHTDLADQFHAAWDAAPADPTEAAVAALIARYPDTVWTGRFSEDALTVLEALGCAKGPA